ncbi:sce7726 family protein [Pseudarthrobacter sp. NS4]|uniref:sce7726 family protein n=1 Tax=Pseudarthrobacter sp. NS4 TaxID=2973976 RepID=UPI002162B8A7|nr:sce7726 family protein [Pseudarthrobacter sp. NS4]
MTAAVNPLVGRRAVPIFSSSTLRQVMNGEVPRQAEGLLLSMARERIIPSGITRHEALEILDGVLRKTYRNEHVYKSTIVNKILLGRHTLRTATLVNEFSVGNSCVDTVIINGEATAYEIKTELDSSAKLTKQISDYRKVFRKINVVVHESMVDNYSELVAGTDVGLLALTSKHRLSVKKVAKSNTSSLDVTTMMKALRKKEYTEVLIRHFGRSPSVPSTQHFSQCLDMALSIDPVIYQRHFEDALRARKPREPSLALDTPCHPLRYVYLQLDPARSHYERIDRWLRGTVD